jgi:hypothetical protein
VQQSRGSANPLPRLRRALLLAALLALGCAGAEPAARAPEPEPAKLSPIALREDQVARLREHVRSFGRDPRRAAASEELADALVGLARELRAAAVAEDRRAADVAPPRDASERPPSDDEVESDAPPAEQDLAEQSGAARLARDEAALATLAPKARALLIEADQRTLEAIARYGDATYRPHLTTEEEGRICAARARLLDELGQRAAARRDWFRVIRRSGVAGDVADAYLSFATFFAERGSPKETATALERAAESAAKARDPKLVARVCAFAAKTGVKIDACR